MTPGTPVQPTLESLMAGYMKRQAEAAVLGLGMPEGAEVLPYEAGPVQPIDARLAWEESLEPLVHFGLAIGGIKPPPGWVNFVAQAEPQIAVAMCVGNYPQLVRDFHTLLRQGKLSSLRPTAGTPSAFSSLSNWADNATGHPAQLIAHAVHRLTRRFDRAEDLESTSISKGNEAIWANERAARLWHQGRAAEAASLWQTLPPSLPVRFNRAMAALFSDERTDVATLFQSLIDELPETSAWRHLARLYQTMGLMSKA